MWLSTNFEYIIAFNCAHFAFGFSKGKVLETWFFLLPFPGHPTPTEQQHHDMVTTQKSSTRPAGHGLSDSEP